LRRRRATLLIERMEAAGAVLAARSIGESPTATGSVHDGRRAIRTIRRG
jgi:hypothetical protein